MKHKMCEVQRMKSWVINAKSKNGDTENKYKKSL